MSEGSREKPLGTLDFLLLAPGIVCTALGLFADLIGLGTPDSGFGPVQVFLLVFGLLLLAGGVLVVKKCSRSISAVDVLPVRKKLILSAAVFALFLTACYGVRFTIWSWGTYSRVQANQRGWRGQMHAADPLLGYRAIPDSNGFHVFSVGPEVPTRYGKNGFRVPVTTERADVARRPCVLTLGDSFTYGDACVAEDTYTQKLADMLGATALNAGRCGYGLAHMVLLSRELIPEYQPEIVVVQFSPWLATRATKIYLASYNGRLPGPYFAESVQGSLEICPPVFRRFDANLDAYRQTPKSVLEFLSFSLTKGVPWRLYDDFHHLYALLRIALGAAPAPCLDEPRIERCGYTEILGICEAAGARMVIVVPAMGPEPFAIPSSVGDLGVPVVRADLALIERLPERTTEAYREAYAHWRGDPPTVVDEHPNPLAHTIIATCLFQSLQEPASESSGEATSSLP